MIIEHLQLPDVNVLLQSSDRPNLVFQVIDRQGSDHSSLVGLVKNEFDGSCGIVYCQQRKDTVEVAYQLQRSGINATYYHAGLDVYKRHQIADNWKAGKIDVICATVAFGMGIDKKKVKFVIHNGIPPSIENYVQESGRAGRDGTEAHCIVFFKFEDRTIHLKNMSALPDGDEKQQRLKSLNHMVNYCMIPSCRKSQLVRYFDGASSSSCNERCDVCKQPPNPPLNGTEHAKSVVACVQSMLIIDSNISVKYLALTYRGSRSKDIVKKGYVNAQNHGNGSKDFNSKTMYKFIHLLITGGILQEKLRTVSDTKTTPLLVLGEIASQVLDGDFTFVYYK